MYHFTPTAVPGPGSYLTTYHAQSGCGTVYDPRRDTMYRVRRGGIWRTLVGRSRNIYEEDSE